MVKYFSKRKLKIIGVPSVIIFLLYIFGVFTFILEQDFSEFSYPYEGNLTAIINDIRIFNRYTVPPINDLHILFLIKPKEKCITQQRLVILIKSHPKNLHRRNAIRLSWGIEDRFIKRIFLFGENDTYKKKIQIEALEHNDVIQGNFTDSYFNNTLKTMLGFQWAVKFCSNSDFYLFVDDDYYVNTKNVLEFINNPLGYPDNKTNGSLIIEPFYAGFVFNSSPLRYKFSKWYVSLREYPYNKWPPYVTAGAYIVSQNTLLNIFYGSFYTKPFRFDDIYLGLIAYKLSIKPIHSDYFVFYKKHFVNNYKNVIASHGFQDIDEMLNTWNMY